MARTNGAKMKKPTKAELYKKIEELEAALACYKGGHVKKEEEPAYTEAEVEEFGRAPREGYHFTRNILSGKLIEEADGTPFTASVESETYWSS